MFSFFKILNLKSFAESFATYNVVTHKWAGWGYVYAFVELALSILFLLNFQRLATNAVIFSVMSISIVGVL